VERGSRHGHAAWRIYITDLGSTTTTWRCHWRAMSYSLATFADPMGVGWIQWLKTWKGFRFCCGGEGKIGLVTSILHAHLGYIGVGWAAMGNLEFFSKTATYPGSSCAIWFAKIFCIASFALYRCLVFSAKQHRKSISFLKTWSGVIKIKIASKMVVLCYSLQNTAKHTMHLGWQLCHILHKKMVNFWRARHTPHALRDM
jgi:hypothetical protein